MDIVETQEAITLHKVLLVTKNADVRKKNSLSEERAHCFIIQWQIFSPKYMHTSSII